MSAAPWPPILVLGRDTCSDTIRSRAHLAAREISYAYRNVELDAEADAINRSYNDGVRVTPTILIGDPLAPARVVMEPSDDELDAAIAEATPDQPSPRTP
jgi:glutaredoxin